MNNIKEILVFTFVIVCAWYVVKYNPAKTINNPTEEVLESDVNEETE